MEAELREWIRVQRFWLENASVVFNDWDAGFAHGQESMLEHLEDWLNGPRQEVQDAGVPTGT